MYYKPDNGFEIKKLDDAQVADALSDHRWSAAYGFLGLVSIGGSIFLMVKHQYGYAILMWILGQISSFYAGVLHKRAHEVLDE